MKHTLFRLKKELTFTVPQKKGKKTSLLTHPEGTIAREATPEEAKRALTPGVLPADNQVQAIRNAGGKCLAVDDHIFFAYPWDVEAVWDGIQPRIKVSPWVVEGGYCAMRYIEGTDPSKVENRVAFIEKTPRVRVADYDCGEDWTRDGKNWECGPKGDGGSDGHIPENELYGFYPPSREWCDKRLVELGYDLPGA